MNILEKLNLDRWFGIVFYLGVLLMAGAMFGTADFVQKKDVFGLGLGMILIGIAHFIAEKYLNEFIGTGIVYTKVLKHNFLTILLIIIGSIMSAFFLFRIVKALL